MSNAYETIDDLMLDCVTKSKVIDSPTLWTRFCDSCGRNGILAMPAQAKHSIKRLIESGKIVRIGNGVKRV
jgi:hypothetical protein